MNSSFAKSVIVLLGVGHTNAHIVRMWKMHPLAEAELVCISNHPRATYSGMLPGVLSGQYSPDKMEIDLVRLCKSVGCRLILDEVTGIDRANRTIFFGERTPLRYDLLAVGVGSKPSIERVVLSEHAPIEPIKPMQTFLTRLTNRLQNIANQAKRQINIAIVGGGVGGVEIACCLSTRLKKVLPHVQSALTLVTGGEVAEGTAPATRRLIRRALQEKQIELIEQQYVEQVSSSTIRLANGSSKPVDLVLWATAAVAPDVLALFDVAHDDRGFLTIRPTLQTVSDDRIFAVGDCGTAVNRPNPKAGVYAVRQGPVLWENLGRFLRNRPLREYRPQKNFLKLINTGDGQAIGEYGRRAFRTGSMWRLKNRIDSRFMRMYQDYRLTSPFLPPISNALPMRCLGCGGKVSAETLREVLQDLQNPRDALPIAGAQFSDDAAIVECSERQVTVTVDFFSAPFDDPFLFGRVTAAHAASDCFAMGATPSSALAMVQIPIGHPRRQRQVLRELLDGALAVFRKSGAGIVGGHTIEGPTLLLGFTMLARQLTKPLLKSALRPGDRLILTKPLGSGVLLAAHMRNQCPGDWFVELVHHMQQSNQFCAELAQRYAIEAMTDVTGFGLAGHLLEMLQASHVAAAVDLDRIPTMPGAKQLAANGIESTLAPDNRAAESQIEIGATTYDESIYRLMFDPQTCGGMLIAAKPRDVDNILAELHRSGFFQASLIGEVHSLKDLSKPLILK